MQLSSSRNAAMPFVLQLGMSVPLEESLGVSKQENIYKGKCSAYRFTSISKRKDRDVQPLY